MDAWPALTRFYGIKPWEMELFTPAEFNQYVRWYNARVKAENAR